MAAVRSRLLRSRACADVIVCHKRHLSSDRTLFCIASWILLATEIGSPDGVVQSYTSRHSGKYLLLWEPIIRRRAIVSYDVPAARPPQTNARQRVPVMATQGLCTVSFGAHFIATIHLKFIGFNTIEFLQSENIFVLTEALRYHKHLSASPMDDVTGLM